MYGQRIKKPSIFLLLIGATALLTGGIAIVWKHEVLQIQGGAFTPVASTVTRRDTASLSAFQQALMGELQRQIGAKIRYRDGYYEGGEPPARSGVCTDVVLRAYRAAGVDLQQKVAADIRDNADFYHVAKPDANIDHRRCRNLIKYFARHTQSLPLSGSASEWQPGDVVFWDTDGKGKPGHVGMIATGLDSEGNPTIVHHWPGNCVVETIGLHTFPVVGHFRGLPL